MSNNETEQPTTSTNNIFNCTREEALASFEALMESEHYTDFTKKLKRVAVQKWINQLFGTTESKPAKESKPKKTKKSKPKKA